MKSSVSPWQLGATLYCPATRSDLFDVITNNKLEGLQSLVICLEDAVSEGDVEPAVTAVQRLCAQLADAPPDEHSSRPLVFIRPRNLEMASRLVSLLELRAISGFVLPKFTLGTLSLWWHVLEHTSLLLMPTLESAEVFDQEEMARLAQTLSSHPIHSRIIALRIGGNDLLSVLSLRRPKSLTLYDTPLGYVIKMLVATFCPKGFSLTAPVCEQFEDNRVLRQELELDKAHGLVGKTAIHPSQVTEIQAMFKVSESEREEAERILQASDAVFQFKGAMCEPATHRRWANSISTRARIFGSSP